MKIFAIVLVVYFLPSLIAVFRRHTFAKLLFVMNATSGWTVVGWLKVFIYSLMSKEEQEKAAPATKENVQKVTQKHLKDVSKIRSGGQPNPEADRSASVKWARQLLKNYDGWVILDTETTGISPTSEIIQISILSPKGEVLLDSLVRPIRAKRMPARAQATHGIAIEQLNDAPTYAQLLPEIKRVTKDKLIVAYNAEYDSRLIRQTANLNGAEVLEADWTCAMHRYSAYVGEWVQSKRDYKWQKLPKGDHSALGDCKAALEVIKKMAL